MRATHSNNSNPQKGDHATDNSVTQVIRSGGRGSIQYGRIPAWILLSQDAHACRIYAILTLFKNEQTDTVFPGLSWLAGAIGVKNPDKVSRHIDKLVECGAVDRERRKTDGGMRTRNVYTLHWLPPEGYTGPMSTSDVEKSERKQKSIVSAGGDVPPSRGVRDDQEKQVNPQVDTYLPQGGYVPTPRGGHVPTSRGGLSTPNLSTPNPPLPPVDEDDRNANDETETVSEPDPVDMATVEALQHAYADTAPNVETTRGGDKNLETQNPDTPQRVEAKKILAAAFDGIEVVERASEANKLKAQLVDALTTKLMAGATRAAAKDGIGNLSDARGSALKLALYRVEHRIGTNPGASAARAPKPTWCGCCHESTRMTHDDRPRRCPDCHPEPNSSPNSSPVQQTLRQISTQRANDQVRREALERSRELAREASQKRKQSAQ